MNCFRLLANTNFLMLFAFVFILGGCEERTTPPPVVQEATKPTPEQKFTALLKKAEAGDAEAQFNLGWMFFNGYGVPKDVGTAWEWYQKAAKEGDTSAQLILGLAYAADGYGVPKDSAKAWEWYQKAAKEGDAGAQFLLGVAYADGYGMPKDAAKALEWFQKAAAQGHADAQTNLGEQYMAGNGVAQDRVLAYAWSNLAAASGGQVAAVKNRGLYEIHLSLSFPRNFVFQA